MYIFANLCLIRAIKYGKIIETGLIPFVRAYFPAGHQLQQDNDPKHSSKYIWCLLNSMVSIGGRAILEDYLWTIKLRTAYEWNWGILGNTNPWCMQEIHTAFTKSNTETCSSGWEPQWILNIEEKLQ